MNFLTDGNYELNKVVILFQLVRGSSLIPDSVSPCPPVDPPFLDISDVLWEACLSQGST